MSTLNIIGAPLIEKNENHFLAGSNYLHYIGFIGCSPTINFEPKSTISLSNLSSPIPNLNYIEFYFSPDKFCFKNTAYAVKALCPDCNSKIVEWQDIISNWQTNSSFEATCPQCLKTISIINIDWKKTAGFYQTALIFHGIQAELASPSDQLLSLLEQQTNMKWHYFYG